MENLILFDNIVDFIIKKTQENVVPGFQFVVSFHEIENIFSINLNNLLKNYIVYLLYLKKEIADAWIIEDGFAITLCTSFSLNHFLDYCF